MALFNAIDLADLLQTEVSVDAAVAAERLAWGWLKPVLALAERPNPVPDEVFSWAVQLGAIAHENPLGLASYQLGEERFAYSAEARAQILAEAAMGGTTTGQGRPTAVFPVALAWPDTPMGYTYP